MKIAHITPAFPPASYYGGPLLSVHALCASLVSTGCEVRVLTTDADGPGRRIVVPRGETRLPTGLGVRYCRSLSNRPFSAGLLRWIPTYVRWADVIHLTAVYSFHVPPVLSLAKLLGKPVVWSPRGSLQRWSGTRRRASKWLWERSCVRLVPRRAVLHVTSEAERRDSVQRLPNLRAVVVPNGVDLPDYTSPLRVGKQLDMLFLGRLDPIKAIDNLLDACAQLSDVPWTLTIAGGGAPDHRRTLEAQAHRLEISHRVKIVGHLTGTAKDRALRRAHLIVLPSHSENFGIVVGEALAYGRPVIASTGTPWRELESVGCGKWVSNAPATLAKAIREMAAAPLEEMGRRGREHVRCQYSWPAIAQHMLETYRELST